ncbi:MAG: glycine zipper protein [Noviherbaspirillum sp.]|jgi:outer membrane lipoprotein SlyB|nr:glycine zipper protein [Noviherbaspirillum sp.]
MWMKKAKFILAGASVAVLAACGGMNPNAGYPSSAGSAPMSTGTASSASGYGVVQSIDMVGGQGGGGSTALGTVAGAVVGGVLGNQVGSGRGRTAATVAGAAGGAFAGNQMQRNSQGASQPSYQVAVRMDNGAIQTLAMNAQPNLQVGDRVRVSNGVIVERFR